MAMKLMIVSLLFSSAAAGPCNAHTKIFMPAAENAAGEMQYIAKEGWTSGTCFSIGRSDVKTVKICGPGKFSFSGMSCGRHDYKAVVADFPASENTGECTIHDLEPLPEGMMGSCKQMGKTMRIPADLNRKEGYAALRTIVLLAADQPSNVCPCAAKMTGNITGNTSLVNAKSEGSLEMKYQLHRRPFSNVCLDVLCNRFRTHKCANLRAIYRLCCLWRSTQNLTPLSRIDPRGRGGLSQNESVSISSPARA